MSRFLSDAVRSHLRMLLGEDPTAPKLSDLVVMWLKEMVNDPSVVTSTRGDSIYSNSGFDADVVELRLNNFVIAYALNTVASVRLRCITPTFAHSIAADLDGLLIPATDPALFEKLWAHIALMDERIDCAGFSLIEKPKPPPDARFPFHPFDPYPAFDELE